MTMRLTRMQQRIYYRLKNTAWKYIGNISINENNTDNDNTISCSSEIDMYMDKY